MRLTEAKRYLRGVRKAVERLPILLAKKQVALDRATSGVAGGGNPVASSNISNIPEAYAIQVEKYTEEIKRTERIILEASRLISLVEDPISQDILDLYYVEAEPWWAVADALKKNYTYTCGALHGKALNDFRNIFENQSQPEF